MEKLITQEQIQHYHATHPMIKYGSFKALFASQAERYPEKTALISGEKSWTYRSLYEEIGRRADAYREAGKTCLAVLCDGTADAFVAVAAGVVAGLQVAVLEGSLPEGLLATMIAHADADELWDSQSRPALREALTPGLPPEERDSLLFFTSGTTRQSQAVQLRQQGLMYSGLSCAYWSQLGDETVELNLLPISHVYGFSVGVFTGLYLGGTVVFGRGRTEMPRDCAEYRPTLLCCVPAMLKFLLYGGYLNDNLVAVFSGGSAAPAEIIRRAAERSLILYGGYGLTETSGCALGAINQEDPGRYNLVMPGYEMKLGEDGEILLKCFPGIMKGYYKNPAATEECFDGDGWYHTGDMGVLDEQGFLRISGRKKEMLVFDNGEKLFQPEYEESLYALAGTTELALLEQGRKLVLAVYKPGATAEDIAAAIAPAMEQRSPQTRVNRIWMAEAPLPKTPIGKLNRRAIRVPEEDRPRTHSAPASPLEEKICTVFAEALGQPDFDPEGDFFSAGADSLHAMQAVTELQELGITPEDVYRERTPRALAAFAALSQPAEPDEPTLAERIRGHRNDFYMDAMRLAAPIFTNRYEYSGEKLPKMDGPFLLMVNHTCMDDTWLLMRALRRPLKVVTGEHLLQSKKGKFVKHAIGPIAAPRGASRTDSMMQILKQIRRGKPVAFFPEGGRTPDGVTVPVSPATGMLARSAGCPLITYRIEGGYFATPKWAKFRRRGPVSGRVVRVYTAEELKAMSAAEITAAIDRDLYVNASEQQRQRKRMLRYRGEKRAEGLEDLLVACPNCGAISTVTAQGNNFSCSACGMAGEADEYGFFKGDKVPCEDAPGLQARVREMLLQKKDNAIKLWTDKGIALFRMDEKHNRHYSQPSDLTVYPDRMEIDGRVFPFEGISDVASVDCGENTLLFQHTEGYFGIEGKKLHPRPVMWLMQAARGEKIDKGKDKAEE